MARKRNKNLYKIPPRRYNTRKRLKMAKVMSSQGSDDGRFAYLLNPIRDLAKNWEIDIATYLEEYLAELDSITITFNDGATTLNFAQAALLIQGTACVYSKKVEYLYNLVFQMLELLRSKRQMQQKNANEQGKETNSFSKEMEENHFLSLDDIKEQKQLEMNEDENTGNKRKSAIQLLPCMPTSLIPLEEAEKGNIMLYNRKGEILGNKHDYRLNLCSIHHSGALLLHMCNNLEIFDVCQSPVRNHQPTAVPFEEDNLSDGEGHDIDLPPPSPVSEVGDNPCPEPKTLAEMSKPEVQDVPAPTPPLRRSTRLQQAALLAKPANQAPKLDSWKREDPHEEKQQALLHKGKTIKILKKLQQKNNNNNTKGRKKLKKITLVSPIAEYCAKAYFSHAPKFSKNNFKIPQTIEVEYIYWTEMKAREKFWKSEQKKKLFELKHVNDQLADEDNQVDDFAAEVERADSDDENVGNEMPDLLVNEGNEDNLIKSISESLKPENMQVVSSYEMLVQKYVENYLSNAAQYYQITDLAQRVNEWEDKIKPKLEEEEQHEPFDIHAYGTRILDCYSNNNRKQTIPFSSICADKKRWEICRYFLATLQLVNNYNIHIVDSEEMDSVDLTLLSRKRHHEDLKEFHPT